MIDYNEIAVNERQKNILMALDCIAVRKEASATDIIKSTGLSLATVSRALTFLKKTGVIISNGKEITDMGRRPKIYGLNGDYGFFLHFFVGAEKIKGYLSDFCGEIVGQEEIDIHKSIMPDEFCQRLKVCADTLSDRHNVKILSAGISVPGMVDVENRIVRRIPNVLNLKNVALFQLAEDALKVPVVINNSARLSAFGAFIRDFPDKTSLVYIDFTGHSGIGAGIVVDGKLIEGQGGFAGEVSDILVDTRNFSNGVSSGFSGEKGFLETVAGVEVLHEKLYALMGRGRADILRKLMEQQGINILNLEIIEQAVLMQDLDVTDVFNDTMKMWTIAIINICAILDPCIIILGGVISTKNEVVMARIRHYISAMLSYNVNVVPSHTSEYQMYGGLHMIKAHALNNILAEDLLNN